jgi:hypothetical protein
MRPATPSDRESAPQSGGLADRAIRHSANGRAAAAAIRNMTFCDERFFLMNP